MPIPVPKFRIEIRRICAHPRVEYVKRFFMVTILRFYRFRSKNNSSLSPTIIRSKVIRPTVLRPTVFKSTQKF